MSATLPPGPTPACGQTPASSSPESAAAPPKKVTWSEELWNELKKPLIALVVLLAAVLLLLTPMVNAVVTRITNTAVEAGTAAEKAKATATAINDDLLATKVKVNEIEEKMAQLMRVNLEDLTSSIDKFNAFSQFAKSDGGKGIADVLGTIAREFKGVNRLRDLVKALDWKTLQQVLPVAEFQYRAFELESVLLQLALLRTQTFGDAIEGLPPECVTQITELLRSSQVSAIRSNLIHSFGPGANGAYDLGTQLNQIHETLKSICNTKTD